ncbi:MAG: ABC transporter permease subunit [Acidobacteria bacterium]|nr:ABC transporter permease subunit [Acidobacteriota bacterium]
MFKTLLYKEFHENITSRSFIAVLVLCVIIIPLSVYINIEDYRSRFHSYEGAVRQYEDSRKTIGDIYSMGAKAFRPPSNLGFLSFGLEILIPNIAETQIEGISSQGTLESDNKLSPTEFYSYIHGPFDITFLVTMGLSFLAIIFSYASISGEKENGTLKLILSNSVFRSQKMEKIADPIPEKLERKVESSASVATASSSNRELYA